VVAKPKEEHRARRRCGGTITYLGGQFVNPKKKGGGGPTLKKRKSEDYLLTALHSMKKVHDALLEGSKHREGRKDAQGGHIQDPSEKRGGKKRGVGTLGSAKFHPYLKSHVGTFATASKPQLSHQEIIQNPPKGQVKDVN